MLATKYESSTVSSSVLESGVRKSLTRDAKTATLNKIKRARQSQQKQKPETTTVVEETQVSESISGASNTTNENRNINLRRRTPTGKMSNNPGNRQGSIGKKAKSPETDAPDTVVDTSEPTDSLQGSNTSRTQSRKSGNVVGSSGSVKVCYSKVFYIYIYIIFQNCSIFFFFSIFVFFVGIFLLYRFYGREERLMWKIMEIRMNLKVVPELRRINPRVPKANKIQNPERVQKELLMKRT